VQGEAPIFDQEPIEALVPARFHHRDATFAACTPEEQAALEPYTAEREAAALRMFGLPLFKTGSESD